MTYESSLVESLASQYLTPNIPSCLGFAYTFEMPTPAHMALGVARTTQSLARYTLRHPAIDMASLEMMLLDIIGS